MNIFMNRLKCFFDVPKKSGFFLTTYTNRKPKL